MKHSEISKFDDLISLLKKKPKNSHIFSDSYEWKYWFVYMYMKLIQNLGALLFFILVILNKIVHQESKYLRKRTLKYFKLAFIKSISSN